MDLIDIRAFMDVGAPEMLILLVIIVAMMLLGPSKIPELARAVGRAMGEFKRGQMELEAEVRQVLSPEPVRIRRGPTVNPVAMVMNPISSVVATVANELGLAVDNRSDVDIKLDILRATERGELSLLMSAARVLGIATEGLTLTELRLAIMKSITA